MMFNPGDVVVIPYPFTDQTRTKLRPVLVITAPDGQGDFIALAITSKGYHASAVALTQPDMQGGKLPKPSWVRTDKVFTLNNSLMVKTVGRVTAEFLRQALSALCGKIGCQSPS
ncbi:MAG: type II toxin-antitoxin system PemK/MazF family toxin [Gammaproteobacteria bacterium]